MKIALSILGAVLAGTSASAAVAMTQVAAPAPMSSAAPVMPTGTQAPTTTDPAAAPTLTDKEQATLKRCKAMTYIQVQQSSKCTKLMKQAGVTMAAPEQPRN